MAYLGMVETDVYHNHPIVKGFVHIVKEKADERRKAAHGVATNLVYSDLEVKENKDVTKGIDIEYGSVQGSYTSLKQENTGRLLQLPYQNL